ncbi:hypothetical protein CU044_4042 [Streptomyces sp. L-9-10]|nr:hypothetical protein CU044_4042 [Streptomyces sp. L-9-10]
MCRRRRRRADRPGRTARRGARRHGGVRHDRALRGARGRGPRMLCGTARSVDRRRGGVGARDDAHARTLPGHRAGSCVRADGDHHLRAVRTGRGRGRLGRAGSAGRSDGRHPGLRTGRCPAPGRRRCAGRTVSGRFGAGARVRRPGRADGGAVRGQPVRGGRTAVPDRRCRTPTGRRPSGVPRPERRPGEDTRLPYRTRRDRGTSDAAPGRWCGGGRGTRGPSRHKAARRLPGPGGRLGAGRDLRTRSAGGGAPRVHGAVRVRRAGIAPPHRERQGRPAGPAHSRARELERKRGRERRRGTVRGSAPRSGRAARRDLARGARHRTGGRARRLLRARRRLHQRPQGRLPSPRCPGNRALTEGAVRPSDRGTPGRRGDVRGTGVRRRFRPGRQRHHPGPSGRSAPSPVVRTGTAVVPGRVHPRRRRIQRRHRPPAHRHTRSSRAAGSRLGAGGQTRGAAHHLRLRRRAGCAEGSLGA